MTRRCRLQILLMLTGVGVGLALSAVPLLADADRPSVFRYDIKLSRAERFHGDMVRYDYDRSGVVEEDLVIRASRRGDQWVQAEVTGLSEELSRRFVVHALDLQGLHVDANRLTGVIRLVSSRSLFRRDMCLGRMLHHTPPEVKPVIGWNLGGRERLEPCERIFVVDAAAVPGAAVLDLVFSGAVSAGRGRGADLQVHLEGRDQRWIGGYGLTPSWNKAVHDVDVVNLAGRGPSLAGRMDIALRPDRWVPAGLKTLRTSAGIETLLTYGRVEGRFTGAGDGIRAEGVVTGLLASVVMDGRYTTGSQPPRALSVTVTDLGPDPALPVEERAMATGVDRSLDFRRGPFAGDPRPLAVVDGVGQLPLDGGDGVWTCIPVWQSSGVRPAEGVSSKVLFASDEWASDPVAVDSRGYALPTQVIEQVQSSALDSFWWAGRARVSSPVARTVWAAVPACRRGCLWVDGVKVWEGADHADGLDTAVFPLPLAAGENDIRFRAGVDGLSHSGHGAVVPNAGSRMHLGSFGLLLGPDVMPEDSNDDGIALADAAEDGTARRGSRDVRWAPRARPPLAWDLEKGLNVAWHRALRLSGADPVLHGDHLYVMAESQNLYCLDAGDGKVLWFYTAEQTGRADEPAIRTAGPYADEAGVVVLFGSGDLVSLDHGGNVVWLAHTGVDGARMEAAGVKSLGSNVVVHVPAADRRPRQPDGDVVMVFDRASGVERWRLVPPEPLGAVCPVRLRSGSHEKHVLVTGSGLVIDGDRPVVLRRGIHGGSDRPAQLAVDGESVFFYSAQADYVTGGWKAGWKSACRLWLDAQGRVGVRFLWRSKGPSKNGGLPPLSDGNTLYLYGVGTEHHMEYPCPWSGLHLYDAATGQQLADVKPLMYDAVTPRSVSLAGDWVYCVDAGTTAPFVGESRPRAAVVALGDDPADACLVSECAVPDGAARPLFAGDRMYLSGRNGVWCVQRMEGAGARLEANTVAAQVFSHIRSASRTTPQPARCVEPAAPDGLDRGRTPVWQLVPRGMPEEWLMAGPFSQSEVERAGTNSPPGVWPMEGDDWPWFGVDLRWRAVPGERVIPYRSNFLRVGNEWYYSVVPVLDILAAAERKGESTVFLGTVVECREPGDYQFFAVAQGLTCWLAGAPVVPGDALHLVPGLYPLLVRVDIGKLPPFIDSSTRLQFRLGFDEVQSLETFRSMQRLQVQRFRRQLEWIRDAAAGDPAGSRAEAYLKMMGE